MKRKDYWKEYTNTRISDSKKEEIFRSISVSIAPSSLYQRWAHYVRPVASVVWVAILWIAVFVVWFIGDNQPLQIDDAPSVDEETPSVWQFVQASPIWRIIQTQWILWLDNNGEITPIQTIDEWKIITLQSQAKIVFAINESLKATITWPARFTIETLDDATVLLNLLEWSYAQVKTIEKKVTIPEQKQPETELIVKTKQLEVSTRAQKSVDLVITQNDDNQAVVSNLWDEIVVKNIQTQEQIAMQEDSEAVWDLTTMIANVWQTQVSSVDKRPVLAIRYETTQDQSEVLQDVVEETLTQDIDKDVTIGIDESELLALVQWEPSGVDETQNQSTQPTQNPDTLEWRVLDQERMALLEKIFVWPSLATTIQDYTQTQDEAKKTELLQTVVNTVNQGLWVFNSAWSTTASLQNVNSLTLKLLRILENDYFIPPTLIASVRVVLSINN